MREKVEATGSVENIQEKHYRRSMRKEDDWKPSPGTGAAASFGKSLAAFTFFQMSIKEINIKVMIGSKGHDSSSNGVKLDLQHNLCLELHGFLNASEMQR